MSQGLYDDSTGCGNAASRPREKTLVTHVISELPNSPGLLKIEQSLVHFCKAQASCPKIFSAAVKQLAALKLMNELKSFL